jgi:hypothetical protein
MFDLRRAQRAKARLDKAYGKEAEALRKAGKHQEREEKLAEWGADGQLAEDEISEIVAERLINKARRLDVPLPPYPIEGDAHQYEFWETSSITGRYILTQKGRALVRDALGKEKRERFESKARWVTLFTGIIGAAIGLVSVLTNLLVHILSKH